MQEIKNLLKKHTFFSFWYFWTFLLLDPVLPEFADLACEILLRFSQASKVITTNNVKHKWQRSNCLMLILRSISSEIIIYIVLISFIKNSCNSPANVYLFKVNSSKMCKICSKLTKKHQYDVIAVALVFLLLTLNIFYTFLYCFYCWLWTSKC